MSEGILNPIQQLQADFDFDVYTKQEVDTLLDGKADKVDTYTKTETDALLNEKADVATTYTKTETNDLLNGKADKSTTLAGYGITDAYTKAQTDNLLNGKADTNSVYTKEETDNLLSVKANSADVYTKTEANNLLSAKADSANVYTKTESNTLLAGKANVDDVYTKMEIDNQLTVTKDGTWVKVAQNTATNLEKLEGGIEYLYGLLSYKYSQLRKYINGNYYDYETNTDTAYTKTVPAGAMPYAGLEKLGGKTIVWNQLVNPANIGASKTQNGITFTNNGDGSVTVSGTATGGNAGLSILSPRTWADHKFCLRGCPAGGSSSTYCLRLLGQGNNYFDTGDGVIWYHATARYKQCDIVVYEGTVISTPITFRPTFVDLTLMYGAGNEPTTVEQFREMFPADYYEYNAGTLLSAGAESVKSRGENLADGVGINTGSINSNTGASNSVSGFCRSNYVIVQPNTQYYIKSMGNGVNRVFEYTADSYIGYTNSDDFVDGVYFTTSPTTYRLRFNFFADEPSEITDWVVEKHINSYLIPTPIQQLYGYGWSAGTAYNYIDFERKVFVKNVERIDIGTASVDVITAPDFDIGYVFCITVSGKKTGSRNFIASKYETSTVNGYSNVVSRYGASANRLMYTTGSVAKIYVIDGDYADANSFKTGMNGQYIFYGLATPQEIDISEYLTDDNLISVESGGTLTFSNSNGDNYRIPVPSEETYMINLQEAVSNG